jgi:hypothetical protein
MRTAVSVIAPPAPQNTVVVDPVLIDKLGELRRKEAEFKPTADELKDVEKQLALAVDAVPGDQSPSFPGNEYTLVVGLRDNRRTITRKWKAFTILKRILGMKPLIELLTIPLKEAIDKHVPMVEHHLFLVSKRTGPRELTAVAKARTIPAKAA